jgi:hypothetical protein
MDGWDSYNQLVHLDLSSLLVCKNYLRRDGEKWKVEGSRKRRPRDYYKIEEIFPAYRCTALLGHPFLALSLIFCTSGQWSVVLYFVQQRRGTGDVLLAGFERYWQVDP